MGMDFTAIIGHNLSAEAVSSLPERLRAAPGELAAAIAELHAAWPRPGDDGVSWCWDFGPDVDMRVPGTVEAIWGRGELLWMVGPALLSLDVQRQALHIAHAARWFRFLRDDAVQLPLRRTCRALAKFFGSPCAIYVPDNAVVESVAVERVWEGQGIAEVAAWLREVAGPPAPTLAAILRERTDGLWESKGYYIDRFDS